MTIDREKKIANLMEQLGENRSYFVSIFSLIDVMRRDENGNVLLPRDFYEVSPNSAKHRNVLL
jgi:hypothetical protein